MRWDFWRSDDAPGPSTPTPTPTPAQALVDEHKVPTMTRFERTLIDEEKVQAAQYTEFKDVPSCMTLL